jgi:hypothetical protein
LPRDEFGRTGYFIAVPKLLFLILFSLPLGLVRAEQIELQDGTKVDGKILSVTAETVLIEVQTSPTIREEKSYPRADVAKIQRASQDDVAFAEVAEITVPATADSPEIYDTLLEQKVRPFMQNFAYSKHMPEARKLAATLEAERARVAAGEVKVDGEWLGGGAAGSDQTELGGRVQLSKMKSSTDPVAAMMAFEVLEKSHSTSSSFPEAVQVARARLEKLRGALVRTRADLERRTREQQEGLQLASVDRRLLMEQGMAQEKAAIQAQVDRAKLSGSKWVPVLPDAKVLEDLSKLADSEETRLGLIDVETLASGVAAAREAKEQLDAGQLDAARQSLEQAEKLWSQHVLLASLKESLKKAQEEAAQQDVPAAKPAES